MEYIRSLNERLSRRSLYEALFGQEGEEKAEETNERIEWTWEKPAGDDFVVLLNDDKDVKFHRNFSSGTAVVRGSQPMSQNQYFWELKMISPVYGTDMMVGVGTSEADMSQVHDRFISLLGNDQKTWGLSYTGRFHHNNDFRGYSCRFGQGSIIGVHLDLWNGTISFYKNKKYLGIASGGLTGKTLYAMASSTAACSGMRIIQSCSFPSSLQYLCCAKLRELIPDQKSVLDTLTFPPGLHQYLSNNLAWLLDSRYAECIASNPTDFQFALMDSSRDPMLPSVRPDAMFETDEELITAHTRQAVTQGLEDSGMVSIDRGMVSIDHGMVMIANGMPTIGSRAAFILRCCRRRQDLQARQHLLSSAIMRMRTSESYRRYTSYCERALQFGDESRRETSRFASSPEPDRTVNATDNEDEEEPVESEAKRRRRSYNYAVGLSDVDSD